MQSRRYTSGQDRAIHGKTSPFFSSALGRVCKWKASGTPAHPAIFTKAKDTISIYSRIYTHIQLTHCIGSIVKGEGNGRKASRVLLNLGWRVISLGSPPSSPLWPANGTLNGPTPRGIALRAGRAFYHVPLRFVCTVDRIFKRGPTNFIDVNLATFSYRETFNVPFFFWNIEKGEKRRKFSFLFKYENNSWRSRKNWKIGARRWSSALILFMEGCEICLYGENRCCE